MATIKVAARRARLADLDDGIAPAKAVTNTHLALIETARGEIFAECRRAKRRQIRIQIAPVAVVLDRVMAETAIGPAMKAPIGNAVTLQAFMAEPDLAPSKLFVDGGGLVAPRQPHQLVA